MIKKMVHKFKGVKAEMLTLFTMMAVAMLPSISKAASLLDLNGGLTSATTSLTGSYDLVSKLCLAIGGIVGLVGGIRVYVKWNNGEREMQKEIVGWAGACLFLMLTGTVLNVFFS